MVMLAEAVDAVIGVDTHRDTHTAAVVAAATGRCVELRSAAADAAGYAALAAWAAARCGPRRAWAVEGSGSYGNGLTGFLLAGGQPVIEVDRPRRRRRGGKSDELDAVRAGRHALAAPRPALPRRPDGPREAIRVLLVTRAGAVQAHTDTVNQLKALIVTAAEPLRAQLRGLSTPRQITRCRRLGAQPSDPVHVQATVAVLRAVAGRAQLLGHGDRRA